MTIVEIIHIALGSSGLAGISYLIFKTGRIVEKIEIMDKKIDNIETDVKGIKKEIHYIDVRLAVLEAENAFYNSIPEPSIRSEAAKNMWKKRKQRSLASMTEEK